MTLRERILARMAQPPLSPGTTQPSANGQVPISARIWKFLAEGAPMGEQRSMAVAAARALLGAGTHNVHEATESVWRGLERSPVGVHPWTYRDASEIVTDIARTPAPPLRKPELAQPREKRSRTVVLDDDSRGDPADPSHPEHLTDLGNALRLVRLFGADIRYVHAWHRWLVWDGTRWKVDENEALKRMARQVAHTLLVEANRAGSQEDHEKLFKFAMKTEGKERLQAMVDVASHDKQVIVAVEALDAHPWLLNCANGTVDLKTQQLLPHRKEDLLTKSTGVAYKPEASSERLEKFLCTAIPNDELRAYLQRAEGASLVGERQEKVILFLYGVTNTGKTTKLNMLRGAMGEYATVTPFSTWLTTRSDPIPNDLAALVGVRVVISSEANQYRQIDTERVKHFTGGEPIKARFMRAEWFEFLPQAVLWWAANHKPKIASDDSGMWSRVRILPFTEVPPPERFDKTLKFELLADPALREAALAWMVEGLRMYVAEGPGTSAAVELATGAYQREMDVFAQFLEDRCVEGPKQRAKFAELTNVLRTWVAEQSLSARRYNRAWLKEEVTRRQGFDLKPVSNTLMCYGVSLKETTPEGRTVELDQ